MTLQPDSLTDLARKAWKARIYLMTGGVAGLALGLILLFSLKPLYEATMIIAPRLQSGEERSAHLINEGIALPQISANGDMPRDYIKFQQILRGQSVARKLIQDQKIIELAAGDKLFRFTSGPFLKTPEAMADYLQNSVSLRQLGATSSQILTFHHPDREGAVSFLRNLHKAADELIRTDAKEQSEKRISYLQQSLQNTYNPDHRRALADLLLLEEQQRMFISMDRPYSAEIIEPPAAPLRSHWPKWFIILPICILIGMGGGFLYSATRHSRQP